MTKTGHPIPTDSQIFSGLSDEAMLLALCIHPERLPDPARWCREWRAVCAAIEKGPATSEEADHLRSWAHKLAQEAGAAG